MNKYIKTRSLLGVNGNRVNGGAVSSLYVYLVSKTTETTAHEAQYYNLLTNGQIRVFISFC